MADDPDSMTTPPTPTPMSDRPRRRGLIIAAVVVGVVVIAGIVGAVVIANNDDTPKYAAPQITRMHEGCQQWADSYQGSDGPSTGWCDSMAGWMDGRMDNDLMMGQDQGQTMGSMMWQNPSNMAATCEQWVNDNPDVAPAGTDTSAWCGQMVDWMDQHEGGWDGWMTNGS